MMTERLRYRIVVLIVSYDLKKTQQRERERENKETQRHKNWGKVSSGLLSMGFLEACVKPEALTAGFKEQGARAMDWSQVSTSYSED